MGISRLQIDKAIAQLDRAGSVSLHRCAHYVRLAIEAGHVTLVGFPPLAKDYGPALLRAGFETVPHDGYLPQAGDTIVFQAYRGGNPAGHIEMYDGHQSDFKQPRPDIWPGPGYRAYRPAYVIYRP